MLKRKGQIAGSVVPGSAVRLTPSQLNAYTAAFAVIQPEFDELRQMGQQVRSLPHSILERVVEPSDIATTVTVEGIEWRTQAQLLKLPKSEMYLCRKSTGKEFAIVQCFQEGAPYAKTNGGTEILQTGNDSHQLVSDYAADIRHTLRFMASNLVAKAQRVAFEQFPEHNPGKVVRAVSERCLLALGESLMITESVGQTARRAQGVRI
jgi:hypothetical protein